MALTAAWQLALALGGRPLIDITADRKVRVQISLSLPASSSLFSEDETAKVSIETNGKSSQPSDSSQERLEPMAGIEP